MDNYIIAILGVIFFIARAYMNYKKEQEKASKRNPSLPRSAQPTRPPSGKPHDGIPKWLEDLFPTEEAPVQRPVVQVERAHVPELIKNDNAHGGSISYEKVKYIPTELPTNLLEEYRNLPDKLSIEELKNSKAIHQTHKHQFERLDPFILDEEVNVAEVPNFNLREAIIMKAILERPYA